MAESLGSRYVLQEVLGRGAMGQVYTGSIRSTGEQVAIKVLRPELVSDPEVVARFVQERTILMSIADPNVVRVIDLVIEGDTLAIVMELVRGSDLRRLLRTRGTLPPSEALYLTGQLLRGMAVVHAAGIIHRDIKPENVLVDNSRGRPLLKLTDFGVARLSYGASLTKLSGVIGTPEYMAPELVEQHRATPAADVYSAGIVLYEMLCGRTPFAGGHPVAVLRRQADQAPPVIPDVPGELWNLIAWMLAKDPRSRPASAEEADAALAPLERSAASWPALAPWAGPETGTEHPDAWSRTVTAPGAGRVSQQDRAGTASEAGLVSPLDRAGTAPGATILRHRDHGDAAPRGGFGGPAPWPGADGGWAPGQPRITAAPSRRKRQARMAVIAVAAAAVLGLVTTVAMAATHRTSAQPPAGEQTTLATSTMPANPASTPAKGTGTGTAAPTSTASAGGTSAGGVSGSGPSGSGTTGSGVSGGTSGAGSSKTSVSSGGSKTGTSGTGSTGTGTGSTGTGTGSTGTGSTGSGTGTGSTGSGTGSTGTSSLTAAEQQLANQLNPAMFYDCSGRPDLAISGASAALNCSSGTVLAERPAVFTLASGAAQTWFQHWTSTFKTGTACTGGAYVGTWSSNGAVAGQLACGTVPGGYLRIVWVVGNQIGFVGEGSDAAAVYAWWKTDVCGVTDTAEC